MAQKTLQKYPWDPTVIDVFVEHGLTDTAPAPASSSQMQMGVPVRLKTHPFDEAVVYCEWTVPYEAWAELETLDPRIALHWIMSRETNVMWVAMLHLLML
jgi:hypothetical protein